MTISLDSMFLVSIFLAIPPIFMTMIITLDPILMDSPLIVTIPLTVTLVPQTLRQPTRSS